jgi:hypothetical protein
MAASLTGRARRKALRLTGMLLSVALVLRSPPLV